MITSLRESKARLSELVEAASRGQDVLITVRGKVKARLTRATGSTVVQDRARWLKALRALHRAYGVRRPKITIEAALAEIRKDHV